MTRYMLKNTILLAFSGFCAKGFDFLLRAYYSRYLGQEGMGILSLGFSIHGVMLTFSTAGLGVAVSKIISENLEKNDDRVVNESMNFALRTVFLLSSFVMISIFVFAEGIAEKILGEPRVSSGLFCLAPSVLFMGISYCLKGYFYAKRKVAAPAFSEFLEQMAKGVLIYIFLDIFLPKGEKYGCAGVFLGITIGEFVSCIFLLICFYNDIEKINIEKSDKNIGLNLFKVAFPTMVTALLGSLFRMQEEVWLLSALKRFGMSQSAAMSNLGVIHGMVMPMLVFPLTLIGSVSTLLVPEIARANISLNSNRLHILIRKIYFFGIIVGVGVMIFFRVFANKITGIVYDDSAVAPLVRNLSIICPLIFLDSLSCSVLNGMGKQLSILCYNLIDSVLRLLGIYFLVSSFGINGIIIVFVFSNLFTCSLMVLKVLTNSFLSSFLKYKKIKSSIL